MKLKPHEYQIRSVKKMITQASAGLLLDPGLGKTLITLLAFASLKKAGYVKDMLVLAPLRAASISWPNEIAKWDEFKDFTVRLLHGKNKHFKGERKDIYLMNYEGLQWLECQPKTVLPKMLVVDESTKIKNTRTQRFKSLRAMLPAFRRRYILTGLPTPNRLDEIFGQIYVLDEGEALGRYFTNFRNTYFAQTDFMGWSWAPRAGAEKAIAKRIDPLVSRMRAEDYLKLPKLIEVEIPVEMPAKARQMYNVLEDQMLIELEAGEITAVNGGAKTTKLRQICSGWVYDDESKAVPVHEAKLSALADLVDELSGEPLIVGYGYQHERDAIVNHFGKDTPVIGGGTSAAKAKAIVDAWNEKKIPLMLLHPASAAHGLNLQAGGHHIVWFTLPWSLELYLQMNDRLHRQGQKMPVTIHSLIVANSIDEDVLAVLRSKLASQKWLSHLKSSMQQRRRG